MSNSESDIKDTTCDFGSVLAEARQSQNYTVDEISSHLKIPVNVISAIEESDIAALPPPTFTKGYMRAYAKFLEISEDNVVDLYNRAVPQNRVAKLKSRSNLPDERNSQSPLIKTVTAFLIVASIAALIYGSFQYYQEKATIMESELESKERSFSGNSLDSPGLNPVSIEQNARLTDNDELILQPSDAVEPTQLTEESGIDEPGLNEAVVESETDELTETMVEVTAEPVVNEFISSADQNTDLPLDVLKIYAKNGSWMQVHDAGNERLLYTMVPVRGSKVLRGRAPFRISLGNARTTSLVINDLAIDMSEYIRANNTASFTVSTKQQNVIFH